MASRGINKVILIGNLGADPEVRYSQNSTAITNLSIATSEPWKDKQSGEQTEWHRVVCYGRLAEIAGEYLRKGSKVHIEGRLQTRNWQGQDGKDNYTTEIVCNDLQMLDSRNAGTQQGFNQNQPTPQEISEHRLKWLPGYSVTVHSDFRSKAIDWCNDNIQKQSWKLSRFTSVYEDTFKFETLTAAEKFAGHFKGNLC